MLRERREGEAAGTKTRIVVEECRSLVVGEEWEMKMLELVEPHRTVTMLSVVSTEQDVEIADDVLGEASEPLRVVVEKLKEPAEMLHVQS